MPKAEQKGVNNHLPVDAETPNDDTNDTTFGYTTDRGGIADDVEGMDCGPESRKLFAQAVERAKTIVWNGPVGVFEFEKFAQGSKALAEAVAKATHSGATTIIGGGDTATAAAKF